MTATGMLELKQNLTRLSETERREAALFLQRLRLESPASKRELSRRMKEMDAGKKVSLADLKKQLGHA